MPYCHMDYKKLLVLSKIFDKKQFVKEKAKDAKHVIFVTTLNMSLNFKFISFLSF